MAGLIDYSPMFREPAPSPVSRGIRGVGDVLDAILDRRERMKAREAELQLRREQEERIKNQAAMEDYRQQVTAEGVARTAASKLEFDREKESREAQGARAKAVQDAYGAVRARRGGEAPGILAAQGMKLRQKQANPALMTEDEPRPDFSPFQGAPGVGMIAGIAEQAPRRTKFDTETERLAGQQEIVGPGGEAVGDWSPVTPEQIYAEVYRDKFGKYLGITRNEPLARKMAAMDAGEAADKGGGQAMRDQLQGERALDRAKVAGRGQLTPYQAWQIGQDKIERTVTDYEGNNAGLAATGAEGKTIRGKLGSIKAVDKQLESLKPVVGSMGFWERAPVVGRVTDKQQIVRGKLQAIVAPISQIVGSGTPQEAEATRLVEAVTASLTQSPEVATAALENLQTYLRSIHDQGVAAATPGQKQKPAKRSIDDLINEGLKP